VGACSASCRIPADSPASLLQKSQSQLQLAKKSGRNQAALSRTAHGPSDHFGGIPALHPSTVIHVSFRALPVRRIT